MLWNEIIGHRENISQLKLMLHQGRVPHALLFTGPEGVGKMLTATVLAAGLLCENSKGERPCGSCPSCRQVKGFSHPDLLVVRPDGATIKIDQIRDLQRETALAAYRSGCRVGIIDDAERMTPQAANSLLKTLEEPPGQLIFILVSSHRQQLLETIISRCRGLRFGPLPGDLLAQALCRQGVPAERAGTAARLSGGRMGAALEIVESEGLLFRDQAVGLITGLPEMSMEALWDHMAGLEKMERQAMLLLLQYMEYVLRDLLLIAAGQDDRLLLNVDIAGALKEQTCNWSETRLTTAFSAVEAARRAINGNANVRLTSEALLIRLRDVIRED
ncbi:MAG: DNA polymerase III subunit delta' [Veillonellales bacterium]